MNIVGTIPCCLIAEEGADGEPSGGAARDTATAESPPSVAGGGGSVNLRRACSLSDLNKPNVARRVLPSPPNNGRTRASPFCCSLHKINNL